jgi:hypothetical protein
MWRTEDGIWLAEIRSSVSNQVVTRTARKEQEIPAQAASAPAASSVEESWVSEGIALVDRASMVGLAGGAYHANFASMAHESTRRHSENAIAVCRQRRAAAENPGMQEF